LFVVVRNNCASAGGLHRLSVVALLNGALLALFGLVQFFTSAPNMLYWTVRTEGIVFGPFANRNHFAFYMNVAIGLGVGLFLALRVAGPHGQAASRPHEGNGSRHGRRRRHRADLDPVAGLLQDPPALWTALALVLMLSSTVFCLSRGGFVALVGGFAV